MQWQIQIHLELHVQSQLVANLPDELVDPLQLTYLVF